MGEARYSVVQFVPDLRRGETINVGVLLAQGDSFMIRFVERGDPAGPGTVRRFSELIDHLATEQIGQTAQDAEHFLDDLAHRRFSHFRILQPRHVAGDDPRSMVDDLFTRLIRS